MYVYICRNSGDHEDVGFACYITQSSLCEGASSLMYGCYINRNMYILHFG